ncbi:hypothetical protein HYC85_002217 [Camellia sinensis]|uniref:Myb-like domain-containing protein n=1 Tax=Camellia sinensis TaxID=4442 RepID=A0A7J7IA01_CAMSI|nr:hypothetical protein HYC85_002217 [Camellia sinensis]
MPQRNSISREQPNSSTPTLRRSPRLLSKLHSPPQDPKTPSPKSRANSVHPLSLTSSHERYLKKTHKQIPNEVPNKFEESKCGSKKISEKLNTGSRRSATFNGGACLRRSPRFSGNQITPDEFVDNKSLNMSKQKGFLNVGKVELGIDLCKQVVAKIDKKVTRSSSRRNADECAKKTNKDQCNGFIESASIQVFDKEDFPDVGRAKLGTNSCKQFGGKLEKRSMRSSGANKDKCTGFNESASIFDEEDSSDVEIAKEGANSCKKFGGKLEKRLTRSCGALGVIDGGEEKKERDLDKRMKVIGVKRKRNQVGVGHGIVNGWTKDQESALQRAYFTAKPTPHFWKKVAKLVPGKSAHDCFDKVHADHLTPPQTRTRLRSRKTNLSSFSLSASTLLNSAESKTRRPSFLKQKSHLAQRTVRQLLQTHYNVDQDYEADLFSVLESSFNPSTQIHSTPECEKGKPGYLKEFRERSSSASKKHVSRHGNSYGATIVSPPVLKQIKNKVLHEKYIDKLHCREAKRRAASAQASKSIPGKENRKESYIQKKDAIEAAKSALVSDANDVIHQFQHLKGSSMSNYSILMMMMMMLRGMTMKVKMNLNNSLFPYIELYQHVLR